MRRRLRRSGDQVRISTGVPVGGGEAGIRGGEYVTLFRLAQEGQHGGRERWLARTEDGRGVFVLVDPFTGRVAR
jgi:hypothetical protein